VQDSSQLKKPDRAWGEAAIGHKSIADSLHISIDKAFGKSIIDKGRKS